VNTRTLSGLSFEFFPPKSDEGVEKLNVTRRKLALLNPDFCSVTFGAGGSTRQGTLDTVLAIRKDGLRGAPHLSSVGATKKQIREIIDVYRDYDIHHIVVLRGDMPSGTGDSGNFHYASELVAYIREISGDWFHIDVAAYPEAHPQSHSYDLDVRHFKTKIDAGANSAITQYFFNADAYFHFIDRCAAIGANVPIVPGIMPIFNFSRLQRFSEMCGAEIPRWLALQMESYSDDAASIRAFGLDVITALCERLLAGGAPGLHFYTMNRASLTTEICHRLQGKRTTR
jgi:methylenetetrahydrofolate reductase (NADPH)